MFGWTLIRKEEKAELEKHYFTRMRVIECHRWFSGWKDLDIIWDYLMTPTYFGSIGSARYKYAVARGTNEYGAPLTKTKDSP
jgi:hypothetical protein